MLKRILFGLLLMLFSAGFASAQSPPITSGIDWLTATQNIDKSWGNASSLTAQFSATSEGLEALRLTGNIGVPYQDGLNWLNTQPANSTDFISKRLRIRLQSGVGINDDLAQLLSYRNTIDGNWGADDDYTNFPLDTSLALQALKAANYTDQSIIFPALNYLVSTQNPDGGWGFTKDDDSNVFVTAHAISALAQYKTQFLAETQVKNAVAFLLSRQKPDGGFGSDASSVYETALAFSAIVDSGQMQILPLQNAISYFTASQSSNGSWNDDPYSTALALQALVRVKPDLTLAASDINVSPTVPTAGQSVTITATIHNTGLETTENITVRLTDNGTTAGEQTISAISPGTTGQAVFTIPAITPYGDHNLGIVIDPANAIAEMDEANNTASTRIWAKSAADLVVYPEYLAISPNAPKPGETITLSAMVANMGESAAQNATATLYDGDPAGGVILGSFTIAAIDSGSWGSGSITFSLSSAGSHDLTLVVDPQHLISEDSRGNNAATKTVTVMTGGTAHSVDLIIPPTGLQITPSRPRAGESVTVTVTAQNLGNSSATGDLELFDGDPATGILLHRSTITMSAGETRTVAVPWTVGAGIHTLKAYLDRAALVTETDKLNNSRTLVVMADMVDIEISASDIAIEPAHPMAGDPATVKVTVQNRGILPTGSFAVNLYNGDPAAGGVILQSFEIADLAGDAAQELSYSFAADRGTYRFHAVCDPDNRVAEMYEENNLAIRSLLVKSSAEAKGPDLAPLEFDLSAAATDPQSLRVSGMAKVKFQNNGDDKVATPFRIMVFEDRDGDGFYTEGTDQALGFWDYTSPLNPGMVATVSVNLSGAVIFRDSPIYAILDSGQAVFEQDKGNNTIRRGSACEARPITPIEPVLKWQWPGTSSGSPVVHIISIPIVVGATDDNGDARIDQNDVPTVLVNSYPYPSDQYHGKILALRGDTGIPAFSVFDSNHLFSKSSYLASGDIDNDGKPEIVVKGGSNSTLAFESDGTFKWHNIASVLSWGSANPYKPVNSGDRQAIADLDGDGVPEIIAGSIAVLNADGSVRCSRDQRGIVGGVGAGGFTATPLVVDLDMDGKPEILGGNVAYNADCSVKWQNSAITDGLAAIGNFDDDPYPEIVLVTPLQTPQYNTYSTKVWMLDHNGSVKWGPILIQQLEGIYNQGPGGFPVIADFDGDGKPEIGVRGVSNLLILDKDGRLKRMIPVGAISYSDMRVSPTVFDLNGDGRPEILINANRNFKIFDGTNGALLFQEYAGWLSWDSVTQNVIVADVDGNGHAEAIVTGMNSNGSSQVLVYRAKNNDWVNTRRVWNQDTYHVANVNDDGSIPKNEAPSWLLNNSYRCNVPVPPIGANPYLAADLSASYVRIDMADFPRSVAITARIGNGGAKAVAPGVAASFYDGDPAGGGVLIGSAVTSKPLGPGEYEDVSIIWNAPSDGNHQIQAIADPNNAISECDKANNAASLPVYVSAGWLDLSVASEDVVVPADIPEGGLTPISVTVRNSGTLSAENIVVRFYVGNPATGGFTIGSGIIIPSLAAGEAKPIQTSWNTSGLQGASYIYVSVDQDNVIREANEGNNIAMKPVTVSPAEKPDLQLAADDIVVSPASPSEGDRISITATVHNRGTPAGNIKVALYSASPAVGGKLLGTVLLPWIIPAGGTAAANFSVDSVGMTGSVPFHVGIDPDNTICESDKENNQATRTVVITSAAIQSGLATDKAAYGANEPVRCTSTIANGKNQARSLSYDLLLVDENGTQTALLSAGTSLNIGAATGAAVVTSWNTGTTPAGIYTVILLVTENGRTIGRASSLLEILPVKTAGAAIATDKAAYLPGEKAGISAMLKGTSPNYVFSGLNARISVTDSSGTTVMSELRNIVLLASNQQVELKQVWDTTGRPKGNYSVKLELFEDATQVAAAENSCSIIGTAESGHGLSGTIAAAMTSIAAGEPQTLSVSLANKGNEDIGSLTADILLADPVSGLSVATFDLATATALAAGSFTKRDIQIPTEGLKPGPVLAILRVHLQGAEKTLAGVPFTIIDTTSPLLTVSALADGSYTNQEVLNVAGTASDNSGSVQVEINGAAVQVAADGTFSQAVFLQSGANTITTVATDGADNKTTDSRTVILDKSAPALTITSPADNSKTATSPIEVAGSVDETSTVMVKLKENVQAVAMNGTGFTATVTPEPGWNTIEVTATDLAGNPSSQKRSVLFDDQKPSLAITEPSQDILTNKESITIGGTATDPYTAVGVTIGVDGQTYTPQVVSGIFSQIVTFTDEKLYPITVTATNEVGTQTTAQRNVIFDRTPPNLTIDPVATPTNAPNQLVTGTREEGTTVTVTCPTATPGMVEYPTDTTWRIALLGLTQGENRINAETVDLAGNRSSVSAMILYASKAPEVTVSASPTLLWPPNKQLVPVTVDGNVVTFGSDVKDVTVSVADEYGKYNLQGLKFGDTVWLEAWRDGNDKDGRIYTITAVITDSAGNTTTRAITVTVPHDVGR